MPVYSGTRLGAGAMWRGPRVDDITLQRLRQCDCTQHSRPRAKFRRNNLGGLDVAVEQRRDFRAHHGVKLAAPHYAATQDDALRRQSAGQVRDPKRQVVRLEVLGRMLGRQIVRRCRPARFDRRASSQSL